MEDVDKFTSLIKSKESIWNYKSTAYANKNQRRNDWLAVCRGMIPDFDEKTNEDKNDLVLQHQTKWRVLRDGFTRSVKNYNEKLESGSQGKLYLYYEQLHFLHDLYDVKKIAGENNVINTLKNKPRRCKVRRINHVSESSQEPEQQRTTAEFREAKINKAAETTDESTMEEDKHFLLSLLNDFMKIPEDQKLDAKGDIISVIRHYKNTQFDARGAYCTNTTTLPLTATESYFDNDVTDDCSRQSCSPIEIKFNIKAPNNDPLKYC